MNDRSIIELFLKKDDSALSAAQEAYGAYCKKLAFNILGSMADAEECVNDVLLKAWNIIPPNEPKHFGSFIARLTRNAALDRRKYDTRLKRRTTEPETALDELEDIVSGRDDPVDAVIERELKETISEFLVDLPEERRRVFVARYFRFEEVKRIAKEEGRSVSYVKTTLFRLRNELKNYLTERGYEL